MKPSTLWSLGLRLHNKTHIFCCLSFDSSYWDTVLLPLWPCCWDSFSCGGGAKEFCVTTVTNSFQSVGQSQTPPSTWRFTSITCKSAILSLVTINIHNLMAAKSHLARLARIEWWDWQHVIGSTKAFIGRTLQGAERRTLCRAETLMPMLLVPKLKRSLLGSRWQI